MNPPKVDDLDYIHFLIAAQKVFTCTEAARSQPDSDEAPAHDAFTRLLKRQPPDTEALWQEAQPHTEKDQGLLVLDDTTLDKPYANKMELVTWHWSGKHGRAVKGINLLTLLWSGPTEKEQPEKEQPEKEQPEKEQPEKEQPEAHLPLDFRLYRKEDKTKNEHFRDMLDTASVREFAPEYVIFDSWYSGLDNLKKVRSCGWHFFTRLKSNRHVNADDTYNRAISEVDIPEEGRIVHLKGFGFVRVFRTGSKSGDAQDGDAQDGDAQDGDAQDGDAQDGNAQDGNAQYKYWASDDLEMNEEERADLARRAWGIETYHRQLKQYCGAERSQHRSGRAQHNHLLLSLRAFLRLEVHRLEKAVSFYESKLAIIREAVRSYLANPTYILSSTA